MNNEHEIEILTPDEVGVVEAAGFMIADGHGERTMTGRVSPEVYETARRAAIAGSRAILESRKD